MSKHGDRRDDNNGDKMTDGKETRPATYCTTQREKGTSGMDGRSWNKTGNTYNSSGNAREVKGAISGTEGAT